MLMGMLPSELCVTYPIPSAVIYCIGWNKVIVVDLVHDDGYS